MTPKIAFVALALTFVPVLAHASCLGHENQAQSCAAGMVWDATSERCVQQASS